MLLAVCLLVAAWAGGPSLVAWHAVDRAADALAAGDLESAERAANRAVALLPDDSAIYRLRARVSMERGQPDEAIADLERAARLSPSSLLTLYSLAAAYEAAERYDDADTLWRSAGVSAAQLENRGNHAFDQGAYGEAYTWYHQAARLDPARDQALLFRLTASSIIAGKANTRALLDKLQQIDPRFHVATLRQSAATRVDGGALLWMSSVSQWGLEYGMPLSYASNQAEAGFFYRDGSAIAVFDVLEPGQYLLRVRLRHSAPPPVEMAVGLNGSRLVEVSLDRGDNTWSTVELPLRLDAGLSAAQLWFLNNAATAQGDHDAAVAWLELAPAYP